MPERGSWSNYIRRVESNGSVTEGGQPTRSGTVSSGGSRGHHRSRSQTIMSPDPGNSVERSNTQPSSPKYKSTIPDPLQSLEMVWASLGSWFDLLVTEVQKVSQQDQDVMSSLGRLVIRTLGSRPGRVAVAPGGVSSNGTAVNREAKPMDRANVGGPSDAVAGSRGNKGIASSQSETSCEGGPCGGENGPSPSTSTSSSSSSTKMRAKVAAQHDAKLATPLEVGSGGTAGPSSNLLAAAIVQSAPLQRRKAYLSNSTSFNGTQPLCSLNMENKRRSLHLERVAARLLSWQQDSVDAEMG